MFGGWGWEDGGIVFGVFCFLCCCCCCEVVVELDLFVRFENMVVLIHDSNTKKKKKKKKKKKMFSVVFRVGFFSFCFSFVMGVRVCCLVSFLLVKVDFVRLFSFNKKAHI